MLTKLSVKNQADDLLAQFRDYHKQQSASKLPDLRFRKSLVAAVPVLYCAGMPLAEAQDISDAADLTAVIALNGRACGKVVNAVKRGDDDYVATCEDGSRYRIHVRDGRVVVERAN